MDGLMSVTYDDLRPRGAGRPDEFNMYVLREQIQVHGFEKTSLRVSDLVPQYP